MSYDTKYPSHACVYKLTPDCQDPITKADPMVQKTLSEMLVPATACYDTTSKTFSTTPECNAILYDLSQIAMSNNAITDASYQNLLSLANQVQTGINSLTDNEDPNLKKGIEEKERDLNKALITNIAFTTLAVTALYFVFKKI